MVLVVETGYGMAGADSYASVADADAYWLSMGGNTLWTAANTGSKEVALRRASEFIDITFLSSLARRIRGQGLMYPSDTVEYLVMPSALTRATIIVAVAALPGPLLGNPVNNAPFVIEATDKVGELTKSRKYATPLPAHHLVVNGLDLDFIRALLGTIIGPTGGLIIGRRYRG